MLLFSCYWLKRLAILKLLLFSLSTFKLPSVQVWSPPGGLLSKTGFVRFLSFVLRSNILQFTLDEEDLHGITFDCLPPAPEVKGAPLQWDGSQDLDIVKGLVAVKEGIACKQFAECMFGSTQAGTAVLWLTSLGYKTSKFTSKRSNSLFRKPLLAELDVESYLCKY